MTRIKEKNPRQIEFYNTIENNDVENFKLLLKNKEIDPSKSESISIRHAVQKGGLEIVTLLIEDGRADPSCQHNHSIWLANHNKNNEIVSLLWKQQSVKESLEISDKELYDKLIKKDLEFNISKF
jgi:hypothetical protein